MPRGARRTPDRDHIKLYKVAGISLDLKNPRLIIPSRATELDVLKLMYEREALDELALSLSENGYFAEEPVVLVPRDDDSNHYVVVEGNRRVATLKLLLDEKLQEAVGVHGWPRLSVQDRTALESVPAVLYQSRDEVVPYLGFRHISGIKTWEPFQKARYIAQLVELGGTIPDIERSVGDRTNAVRKMYQSYVVYVQITRDLEISPRTLENSYSLLEVALSQSPIKQFLSIPQRLPTERTEAIVPEDKYQELREVVSWVFGDPSQRQEGVCRNWCRIGTVGRLS
ncbi:MAG TPA: ParB/Srx family N-terminal domain-containing protein [Gemmatimonadaceae bacterium]